MFTKNLINQIIGHEMIKAYTKAPILESDNRKVICAADIGYGFVKYAKGSGDPENPFIMGKFPSLTAISPSREMKGEFFSSRDTKKIESGGLTWEVGPDIFDICSKEEVRALHDDYVSTEQWDIFLKGALSYLDEDVIDILVLGLPVTDFNTKEEKARKKAIGQHKVDGRVITVLNVVVVPQPLGALYAKAYHSKEDLHRFLNTNTLVVDPGYLTFDFLVTKGFKVNSHRTDARPGGMNAVLQSIASSISQSIGEPYTDTEEIDRALDIEHYSGPKKRLPLYIYGDEVDLVPHIINTKPTLDASLNFMLNTIGSTKDISQIILGGGPSPIFNLSIKNVFPKHKIESMDLGIYTNVFGFMVLGMLSMYMMSEQGESKAIAS